MRPTEPGPIALWAASIQADGRGRRQRVEIVDHNDQPVRRGPRPGWAPDPCAERGEERARRRRGA